MLGGLKMTGPRFRLRRARAARAQGFTIIEVLIVMAVTGGLFVAAAILISGRQNQTAFDQAIREAQAEIQQVINEVAVGYFPDTNFTCTPNGSGVDLSTVASNGQGTNSGCIFIGKAMQFKLPGTDPEQFAVYTLAGLRQQSNGQEVTGLFNAFPKVIAPGTADLTNPNFPDITITKKLQSGLTVAPNRMWYNNGASDVNIGTVAFVNSLSSYSGSGTIKSGTQQVVVVPATGSTLGESQASAIDVLNSAVFQNPALSPRDPSNGVFVCFASAGTDQSGLVTIGSKNRSLSVTLKIIKGNTTCS